MSTVADKLAKKSSSKSSAKQVRLRLVYIDFWSALKLSFMVGIGVAIVTAVIFFLTFTVIETTGVIAEVVDLVVTISPKLSNVENILSINSVMTFAAVVALINLIITTIIGALAATLYNVIVKITGGLLVGFASN